MFTNTNKKVVIGLSGGVDSSVSAYLLKSDGYTVYGVFFVMSDLHLKMVDDAKKCANFLDIPLTVLDLRKKFLKNVITPFINMYSNGETPNPCVICNPLIKFYSMLEFAKQNNIDHIATGHYASVVHINNRYSLKTPNAYTKDQTYMLYGLSQQVLKRLIFPLNTFKIKDDVRKVAENIGLFTAKKPDSQDICFIEGNDYAKFIEETTNKKSKIGYFVAPNGDLLCKHKGIIHYTVGQRKKLGVALGKPCFIKSINNATGNIQLAFSGENLTSTIKLKDINYMLLENIENEFNALVKLRSSAKPVECTVAKLKDNNLLLKFTKEQKVISKGQAGVLYNKDFVILAGGIVV